MANISNYLEEEILQEKLVDATVHAGLVDDNASDSDLEDGDLADEIEDYDGDRKEINFSTPSQVDGKATIENENQIDFEGMPELTVGYAIITDDPTPGSGNILYWCPPPNGTKTTNEGDTYRLDVGELVCDLD